MPFRIITVVRSKAKSSSPQAPEIYDFRAEGQSKNRTSGTTDSELMLELVEPGGVQTDTETE